MAIIIGSQFDLKATLFNFSRDYFESVELLNKAPITDFPDHFITNVAGTLYQLTKANGVWDDSKKTWTVSPWKKLEFGDKNALTTDGNGKLQKNGVDVNKLTVTNGNTIVSIEANSGETEGISVSSFNSGRPGTLILNGEGLRQFTGGSDTEVWTTNGGTVDISCIPSEGTVAAIQAKLSGIDDTVKGYVDSQVGSLALALVFKGSVSQGSDLPENPKVGDTYVISAIGEYAGETCEVGDTIICTVSKSEETAAKWLVVQKNLDGAVTKGDDQDWSGKIIVGTGGNMVSGLIGTEGQIILADASGNPVYVTPNYATSDDVNTLSGHINANSTAVAAANKTAEDAATLARKINEKAGAAQAAAEAAQTTANEAKAGLESKASKDVATADTAGLMPAYVDGVFDVNRYVSRNTPYDSLSQVLNNAATLIPTSVRRGGMSIKFIQSSDNKYVQYRLMSDTFKTTPANWQGVDDEPTTGSNNLVKSGGVAFATQKSIYDYQIAGLITVSGLRPTNADGRCAIIPIQNGDTIVATASSAYSYFAIIKQLPDFSQTNPSIPYATGESRHFFKDETRTINVSAQDAKYLIVELWRQVTGEAIQNTAPLQLIINGYDFAVTKTQESLVLNNTLKSGCFVPKYGQYVNITDTTITIPAGSRIIYRYNQFYTNNSEVALTRISGAQAEFVCFDTEDNTYKIYGYGELNLKSNLLVCFYVRNSNECSLPYMTYKINGNFDFRGIDNPVEKSNNGLVTSDSIYNYVWVNSDTERPVIGNSKKYSSNGSKTTVFINNVRLQKTHLYRLTLNAVTEFTPNENYTIKVMSANGDASLLTIAQLNGIQISDNVFYFYWEKESSLTYRIGQYGTQALNTISISLSDVTDEMSGSVFPYLWEKGVYIDYTGSLVKNAQWCVSEKIRCSLGDIIHWRSGLSTTNHQISLVLFDANDTLISYISVGSGTESQWQRVLQIDNANVAYCRASFYTTAADGFISIYNSSNPDNFKYIKFNQELLFSINKAVNVKDVLYQNKHKESALMAVLLHKGNDNIKVNDKLSLLHCTDLHGDSDNLERIVEYRNNYLIYLDDAIHTGDTIAGTINDNNPFVAVNGANTILNVAGNHEAWLSSSDTDYLATGKLVYDKIFAPSIADWNVVQPEDAAADGKCYYYKDYRNFRLIVLDNVHWHTGGNLHIIDDASVQKAWFESVLTDAAINSKIVVCAMHYPPIHITPLTDVKGFNDYGVNENTNIGDGWYANDEIFGCVDTFINENNGIFAGWLIGHTHRDYIGYVKGHANQPIVILSNCGLNSYSDTNKNIFGTSAQDCFNIVTFDWIDASNHLIKIVRIGNDMDMYGRSKKSISFNIVNGDVLEVE